MCSSTRTSSTPALYRWDGKWFVKAATHGYPSQLPMHDGHVVSNTIAFFPVFPLVIRGLADITSISPIRCPSSSAASPG